VQGLSDLAKLVIGIGLGLVAIGGVLLLVSRFTSRTGWLPGDVVVQRPGLTVYFPIVTSLVLSAILTLIVLVISWLRR
jgi:multisubunit Na+/H+ antiporter MnhC subunit